MVVKPLLAFLYAPDLDPLLDEPLHDERCFIFASSKPVKHENKQNVKFSKHSAPFNFNDGISGIGADLVARNPFFRNLINDLPVGMSRSVFTACSLLHGNVIMIDLPDGRDSVKADNSLHSITSFLSYSFSHQHSQNITNRLLIRVLGEDNCDLRDYRSSGFAR